MLRLRLFSLLLAASVALPAFAQRAQPSPNSSSQDSQTTLTTNTTVVLVPALVTDKSGSPVFSLKAEDFTLTDDGIPQKLRLEQNSDSEPLALVVVFQTGGAGAREIDKFRQLAPLIEAIPGDVPHRIAIVSFASVPKLLLDFTPEIAGNANSNDANAATNASVNATIDQVIKNLTPGDSGAAILDTLGYAVDLLRDQPPKYRRAILLFSETHDDTAGQKGHLTMDRALRAVSDTNTTIYTFAFSSTRPEASRKAANIMNNPNPGPRHGCMSQDKPEGPTDLPDPSAQSGNPDQPGNSTQAGTGNSPPDTSSKDSADETPGKGPKRTGRQLANQAVDCAGILLPPIALAKLALEAGLSSLRRNVPETVANLTGGEYYNFKNPKTIQRDLSEIANHVPNRYVLSFQPKAPHPGLHSLDLKLKDYPKLDISARTSYWADTTDK